MVGEMACWRRRMRHGICDRAGINRSVRRRRTNCHSSLNGGSYVGGFGRLFFEPHQPNKNERPTRGFTAACRAACKPERLRRDETNPGMAAIAERLVRTLATAAQTCARHARDHAAGAARALQIAVYLQRSVDLQIDLQRAVPHCQYFHLGVAPRLLAMLGRSPGYCLHSLERLR